MRDLAKLKTVTDMVETRDKARSLLVDAYRMEAAAKDLCLELGPYIFPYTRREGLERMLNQMDQRFWEHSFNAVGFFRVMDDQAVREFRNSLEKNPPEFTIDNIKTTFNTMLADSDEIFARGVVNIFRRLDKHYWTNNHDPFKIDKKIILTYTTSLWNGLSIASGAEGKINDIDRVVSVLTGTKHEPHSLRSKINLAFQGEKYVYEDDTYLIRGFKKGSLHITFKDPGLVDKINDIIASWYESNALGAAV